MVNWLRVAKVVSTVMSQQSTPATQQHHLTLHSCQTLHSQQQSTESTAKHQQERTGQTEGTSVCSTDIDPVMCQFEQILGPASYKELLSTNDVFHSLFPPGFEKYYLVGDLRYGDVVEGHTSVVSDGQGHLRVTVRGGFKLLNVVIDDEDGNPIPFERTPLTKFQIEADFIHDSSGHMVMHGEYVCMTWDNLHTRPHNCVCSIEQAIVKTNQVVVAINLSVDEIILHTSPDFNLWSPLERDPAVSNVTDVMSAILERWPELNPHTGRNSCERLTTGGLNLGLWPDVAWERRILRASNLAIRLQLRQLTPDN